jgi:hypothetical protein
MKTVRTIVFIEEIPTDGHSPMKFLCDDGQIYYCKYRLTSKREELDCLIYEVVNHFLLKALSIPTPEIALVELVEGVLVRKIFPEIKNMLSLRWFVLDLKRSKMQTLSQDSKPWWMKPLWK